MFFFSVMFRWSFLTGLHTALHLLTPLGCQSFYQVPSFGLRAARKFVAGGRQSFALRDLVGRDASFETGKHSTPGRITIGGAV